MDAQNTDQVDSLIQEAFAPEAPRSAPTEGDLSVTKDSGEEAQSSTENPWVIKHDGKDITLDDNKYKMYAQMGYNYNQKMHQMRVDKNLFTKEREDFLKQKEQYEAEYGELKTINEFAKQNPAWLETVKQAYQQAIATPQLDPSNPYSREISRLNDVIMKMQSRWDEKDKMELMRETAEKDAKIDTSIDEYKQNYPDLDWEGTDETGLNLEKRIMQHAIDNEIKSFRAAARDFLWDEHMKRAQLNTKEKMGKEIQKQNKLGLGSITSKPQSQIKRSENIKGKSYSDIAHEALQELGLA